MDVGVGVVCGLLGLMDCVICKEEVRGVSDLYLHLEREMG